ncbi:MAG: cell division protein FtsL [Clostridia bacterium]
MNRGRNAAGGRAPVGGSNAYQYDFDYERQEFYVPEEKVEKKQLVLTEIKKKKEDKKVKRSVIANVMLIVALGLVVAFRYASVTQINYENHKLQQEYDQLNAVAENMQVDIESSMSIAEIANIAEKKLGMHKPLSYQIQYVSVETIDQTEYKNTEFTKEEVSDLAWHQKALKNIKLFLGLI